MGLVRFQELRGQNKAVVIPLPIQIEFMEDSVLLDETSIIIGTETLFEARYLQAMIEKLYGLKLKISAQASKTVSTICFIDSDKALHVKEYYNLSATKKRIIIEARSVEGIFWGAQSLLQLIARNRQGKLFVPGLEIIDSPQYSWRGMHLDVARHFFTKEEIKKYLDYLALYKFNVFHWHLTDDQGWRIEIKKYPALTQTGAWRNGSQIGPYKDQRFDSLRYGGFYTQADIKEIVSYAKERHITIVPEIEMPGHSLAALAAYPELSCTGGPFKVAGGWGVFDDVYCTKDETFKFLEDVLTEVSELFPGKYIHIGGDECPKVRWKNCLHCQSRIKKENLENENELQSYFIKRIEIFLNRLGKQVIGWDEILEGGLAPNAAVMSWRGMEGGITAAKQHHYVVMSPGKPCYFDHYQSKDNKNEPLAIGGYNPLDSVYWYNPTPPGLTEEEKKYILGAQGNVWTEYIPTFKQVEYMCIPRMIALSEVLWSASDAGKNYMNFVERLKIHQAILDKLNVNYARHFLTKTR